MTEKKDAETIHSNISARHIWEHTVSRAPVFMLLIGIAAVTLHYFNEVSAGGDPWKTGDWLINYRGGFIRRGALGELFLKISEFANVSLLWTVFVFQVGIFLAVVFYVIQLYFRVALSKEWSLLILSPAFLLFSFYDYLGGFRKEVLAFAAFALLANEYSRSKLSRLKLATACALYLVGCFSHELIALTCPFFLYVVYLFRAKNVISQRVASYSCLFIIAVAITSLTMGVRYYGDVDAVKKICDAVVRQGLSPNVCLGAIDSLGIKYMSGVQAKLGHFLWVYLPVFALAISPILLSTWRQQDRRASYVLIGGLLSFLPLFFVAYDWGRWIHIYIFFVTVLMMAQANELEISFPRLPLMLIIFYLSLWMIPTLYASGNTTNGLVWRVIGIVNRQINSSILVP